jgi:hypothetical protein
LQGVVGRTGHQNGGKGVGKMANFGNIPIVSVWGKLQRAHREDVPESFDSGQGFRRRQIGGRQDAQGVVEQVGPGEFDSSLLTAGHGMTADEVGWFVQNLFRQLNDRALGAPHVRYAGIGRDFVSDFSQYFRENTHGCGEYHHIRATNRPGGIVARLVNCAALERGIERLAPVAVTSYQT